MGSRRGHGEGSIYRRESDGKWCCVVDLGRVNGKRKRKTIYGRTRKEVAEKLKAVLRDQQQGLPIAVARQTVGLFLERWLAEVARPTLRDSTYASYQSKITLYILPTLGTTQLSALTPQHVQTMMIVMRERGLSPRSVQYARAILRKALNQALRWGLVARNVAVLTDAPRVERPDIRPLDPVGAARLLAAVHGDRLEALYTVALALGLRQGEALGLRWRDVDFEVGVLHVRVALQRLPNESPRLVEPKTRQSRRSLPLPGVVAAQLRDHRARQQAERECVGTSWPEDDWDLVFTTARGGPVSAVTLTKQFKRHLAAIGLPDMRFHDLRHSCASLLVAQGIHPRIVMEILGHSTIALTMNTYSHVLPAAQRQAADAMDHLLAARNATEI